jgi:competence protein ComGC
MREFMGFAWQNKAWWIIPMVLVLLILGILIVATHGALPHFIYTLF